MMSLVHVRDLLKSIDYDSLVEGNYIPHLHDHIEKETKRYPPWVYREGRGETTRPERPAGAERENKKSNVFPLFGMTMDYLVRKMLAEGLKTHKVSFGVEPTADIIPELITRDPVRYGNYPEYLLKYQDQPWLSCLYECNLLAQLQCGEVAFTKNDWFSYIPVLQNIAKSLVSTWKSYGNCLGDSISYNEEINTDRITGHPDIVTDTAVLDIKTTSNFTKMAKESFLQTLCYFAMMRSIGRNVRYLGIVLPMQRTLTLFDLEKWNWKPFFELIEKKASYYFPPMMPMRMTIDVDSVIPYIGTHIERGKTLTDTISAYLRECEGNPKPCQMFLRNPQAGHQASIDNYDIIEARSLILGMKIPYFTHASYCINLCNPASSKNPTDRKAPDLKARGRTESGPRPDFCAWSLNILRDDLRLTANLGGRGVVVHVGAAKEISVDKGIQEMARSIREVLNDATEECPLLLETSAGEGNDVCKTIETFSEFYDQFTSEEKKRLKIVVDTCHVYVAGHDPLMYLIQWASRHSAKSIALVHFNDSAREYGACCDRHAPVGRGHIGLEKMMAIGQWCVDNNIPMVTE